MSISPLRVDFASVSATQAEHHITGATMSLMIFPVPPANQGFTIGARRLHGLTAKISTTVLEEQPAGE
jgi:hypothetical protein